MNHEQWTALLEATKGYKEKPLAYCDPEGTACIVFCAGWTDADVALSASSAALLEDNKRLRGWVEHMRKFPYGGAMTIQQCDSALNGAEVPE